MEQNFHLSRHISLTVCLSHGKWPRPILRRLGKTEIEAHPVIASSACIRQRAPGLNILPTDLLVPKFEIQTLTCAIPIVCADLPSRSLPLNPIPNQISVVGVSIEIAIIELEEAAVQFFHSLL